MEEPEWSIQMGISIIFNWFLFSFDGNFVNNVANGIGKFVNSRKEVKGFWLNNKLIGEGTEIRKNGTIYTGQF